MFRDEHRYDAWNKIRQRGIRAFSDQITPALIVETAAATGVALVKSPLCLFNLVWLGIAAALHRTDDFETVLKGTLKLLEYDQNFASTPLGRAKQKSKKSNSPKKKRSKHDPYRNDPTEVTEEAFSQARSRMPLEFWFNLIVLLVGKFEEKHAELHRFHGFRLLAIDGTSIELAYWKQLRDHFGATRNKSGDQKTEARMVMLQFPLTRLPYAYELCPWIEGETTIARRLTKHLRANDLVLLDGCFWSYGLFWDIQQRGAFFALPLKGRKVTLKRVGRVKGAKGLDYQVSWTPKDTRGKWKKEELPTSIELRVITYQIPGFRSQKLVTNVLDTRKITREDWIRLAYNSSNKGKLEPGLMHRRWEIETTYRELKVVQEMEGGLRSRTHKSLQFEVAGHVVLYLMVRWLIVEAAVKHGIDPLRISFTNALRELKKMRPILIIANDTWASNLINLLLAQIAEHLVPYRPGRSYPRRIQSSNYKKKKKKKSPEKQLKINPSKKSTQKCRNQKSNMIKA